MREKPGKSFLLSRETVLGSVYKAIDGFNGSMAPEKRLVKSPHTVIFDGSGAVDSLALTMLIVAVEQCIEEDFEASVTLVREDTFWHDNGPFRSVDTLAAYIHKLLNEKYNP